MRSRVPLLLLLASCIEDFERLTTTVTYEPASRLLRIERVLHNIDADFFACTDAASCAETAGRMKRLDYQDPTPEVQTEGDAALAEEMAAAMTEAMSSLTTADAPSWQALTSGLVESGAHDIEVAFVRTGDALDARVTYTADVASKAATDAGVALETTTRKSKTTEYLVVSAAKDVGGIDSSAPPTLVAPAKVTERTMVAEEPLTWWVLGKKDRTATVDRFIDETAQPIFAEITGLDEAMRGAGLL